MTRNRLKAGLRVSHGWAGVRLTALLIVSRYSYEITTGCGNQRPPGISGRDRDSSSGLRASGPESGMPSTAELVARFMDGL
jgi:hypothetical protein